MHLAVAVAVGDEQVAGRRDGAVARAAQRRLILAADVTRADRQRHFALRIEAMQRVRLVARAVDVVVLVDVEAVGVADDIAAPVIEIRPVLVEDRQEMVAAGVEVDTVLGVAGDARHFSELPALGYLTPSLDDLVPVITCAKRHANSSHRILYLRCHRAEGRACPLPGRPPGSTPTRVATRDPSSRCSSG
ncbi:hypothetical protein CMK11_13225 [Candidatus Poribacteria bacterium]|nr:hypothetical protein [Candidatus Poribacteria bacterium]